MRRIGTWIKRWGWLLLVGAGALFAFALRLSSRTPVRVLELERGAIDSGEKTKLRELEIGRDRVNAEIDHEHSAALRQLDAKEQAKAERLRADPAARVRWLNRLSAKRGGGDGSP